MALKKLVLSTNNAVQQLTLEQSSIASLHSFISTGLHCCGQTLQRKMSDIKNKDPYQDSSHCQQTQQAVAHHLISVSRIENT